MRLHVGLPGPFSISGRITPRRRRHTPGENAAAILLLGFGIAGYVAYRLLRGPIAWAWNLGGDALGWLRAHPWPLWTLGAAFGLLVALVLFGFYGQARERAGRPLPNWPVKDDAATRPITVVRGR